MKRKRSHSTTHEPHGKAYWRELAEKYFDAQTSVEEERALKGYIAGLPEEDTSMDDVKAVMGYFAAGRALSRTTDMQKRKSRHIYRYWTAAACFLAALFIGAQAYYRHNNYCVAYMNGEKYTDREFVMQQMRSSMQDIGLNDNRLPSAEEQLHDLFGSMNDKEITVTKE